MLDLSDKKVLIVEDEEMNFIYLKQIFRLIKGEYERVKTAKDAIEYCKNNNYDFILMDIQLPDMSGIKATKEIREFNKTTPIIAQTACRTPDEIEKVLDSGCNEVLIKPFKIEDLSNTLTKYL